MKPVSKLAEEYLHSTDSNEPPVSSLTHHAKPTELPIPTSPLPPSTPETAARLVSMLASDAKLGDVNAGLTEVEGRSELDTILDDLVHGNIKPTLPWLTEDDVSLDMDEVKVKVDIESNESEWETNTDEESSGGESGGEEIE
jgi:hypothetical protein